MSVKKFPEIILRHMGTKLCFVRRNYRNTKPVPQITTKKFNMKASKAVSRFFSLAAGVIFYGHVISTSAGVNHAITTSGLTFSPSTLSINAGDSVTWNNLTVDSHTTTSSNSLWSSSANGFTFTFASSGTYGYYCIPHHSLGMVGTITVAAVAIIPPTVSITSPATGTIFAAPANVTIQATTSDSDSTVSNVQFLVGSTLLLNKTTAPFTATTNNLPAGTYILSAIASDNLGAKATNTVSIIVDALPTVTITNPVSGTTLSAPASLILKANAADSDGSVASVKFLQGSTTLGTVTAAPFSMPVNNLPAAAYTFSAIATDNNGLTATNSITVNVINPATVSIATPAVAAAGRFQFSYSADIGLSYVVQVSTNLLSGWNSIATNQATANPMTFTNVNAVGSGAYYRVGRLPNP